LCNRNAGQSAEHRKHKSLGQQLPRQSSATDAEREAHGDFTPATHRSGEKQVRHIRARDEQPACGPRAI
jgi:hypothetical protein